MGAFIWSFSCDAQLGRDPMAEIAGGIILWVPSVLETHCYPTGTDQKYCGEEGCLECSP